MLPQIDKYFLQVCVAEMDNLLLVLSFHRSVFLIEKVLESVEREHSLLRVEPTQAVLVALSFSLNFEPNLRVDLLQPLLFDLILQVDRQLRDAAQVRGQSWHLPDRRCGLTLIIHHGRHVD